MAGIITCRVGAKMRVPPGLGRTRQPRRTKRRAATKLIGGPLAGRLYGHTPGITSTITIALRGQAGSYIQGLWSPL